MSEIDVREYFMNARKQYAEGARNDTFNLMVYGSGGVGKTSLLATARKPVVIHSFDSGGTKVLEPWMEKGEIVVKTEFEEESFRRPTAYEAWDREYSTMIRQGIFNDIGTYCLDSATLWADSILNWILKKNNRTEQNPQIQDWGQQMKLIYEHIKVFTTLPCDCVLTGHIDYDKDEASGILVGRIMLTGKMKEKLPILFDEVYRLVAKETSKGTERLLQTQPERMYMAKTRLGAWGRFEKWEQPDIKHLLEKAGKNTVDKPLHV